MNHMIRKAITSPVYKAIVIYTKCYSQEAVREDKLLEDNWNTLYNIYNFLNQLTQTTLALESSISTLDQVLPAIDFILKQFELGKEQFKGDKTMAVIYNSRQAKMEKYYNLTKESPAYITALVLDPNSKQKYIESNQRPEQVKDTKRIIDMLWEEYKPAILSSSVSATLITKTLGLNMFLQQKRRY